MNSDSDDYCGPEWQPWKFGMTFDDFWTLLNEFNTVPSAIQTYGDFCHDFEGIACNAKNEDDFRNALRDHRKTQLRSWRTSLENMSHEVGRSHGRMPIGFWNDLLDLIAPNPLLKPVDELGWQSPVSLQGLIEVLQHVQQRLVPTAPLAIKPPTPSPSPSAEPPSPSSSDSSMRYTAPPAIKPQLTAPAPLLSADTPPPSSDSNKQQSIRSIRTLRPRKQAQKKNAIARGRIQKRDTRDNPKGKRASLRKIRTRASGH